MGVFHPDNSNSSTNPSPPQTRRQTTMSDHDHLAPCGPQLHHGDHQRLERDELEAQG
jgi:hypothetical protein